MHTKLVIFYFFLNIYTFLDPIGKAGNLATGETKGIIFGLSKDVFGLKSKKIRYFRFKN